MPVETKVKYVFYQGITMIVKREFQYRGCDKVEVLNPKTNTQFVVNAADIQHKID